MLFSYLLKCLQVTCPNDVDLLWCRLSNLKVIYHYCSRTILYGVKWLFWADIHSYMYFLDSDVSYCIYHRSLHPALPVPGRVDALECTCGFTTTHEEQIEDDRLRSYSRCSLMNSGCWAFRTSQRLGTVAILGRFTRHYEEDIVKMRLLWGLVTLSLYVYQANAATGNIKMFFSSAIVKRIAVTTAITPVCVNIRYTSDVLLFGW